jgi:Spy/CpxP family protein refolding chaperone
MSRHFACVFLVAFLGSAGASAAPLCEQQRGDGKKPDAARQDDGPPRWKWWLYPDSRKELRLTDLQSKKIDEVWEATAPKLREKWHEIERLEEALARTIKENTADVAIVAQQVEKVEKLRAENNATRTVMIYRMHLLLTPEQRVKVDEMRARMDAERKKQDEERKRQGRGDRR